MANLETSHSIVSIDTALSIPSGVRATLDPLTLYLYNKNTTKYSPFLGLDLSRTYLDGNTVVNITDKVVTILNETEMVSWFGGVFSNAETSLSVKGDATVHLGALKSHINIDKTEQVPTLRKLDGFSFGTLQVVLPADADGTNVKGDLTLPNWSPLTIGLGNLTLNIFSGSVLIGNANLLDVVVPPGNTTLSFRGQLFLPEILKNIGPIITSQASALKDGNINITASGNASVVNGQHIGYVESVLNNEYLSTQVSVLGLVTQLAGGLLSSNNSLGELGGLFGGLIANLTDLERTTGVDGGDGDDSVADVLGGLHLTKLLSMASHGSE